jgi:signal transduction histidine kinase
MQLSTITIFICPSVILLLASLIIYLLYLKKKTKQLEHKIKHLKNDPKETNVLDIIGHELRTPLSVIKINSDLLESSGSTNSTKYVKRIQKALDTETKLLNKLLTSSKIEGKKIDLNLQKVDINEKIEDVVEIQKPKIKKKKLELEFNLSTQKVFVYADPIRVIEILNNLLENAIKYTNKGSIEIETKVEGNKVYTSIKDTGRGIKKKDLQRLGEKFFRVEQYSFSEFNDDFDVVNPGGVGLGLYVTFNLIKKMGGEIDVDSKVGEGSTFTFTLPKYKGQRSKKTESSKNIFKRLGFKN